MLPSSRVVLSQAACSVFPCTSYMYIQNPQRNTQGGSSAGILSLGNSSLSVTCLANSSHFDFLDLWLCLLDLERQLGSSWVSPPRATVWKLPPGCQQGRCRAHLVCFLPLRQDCSSVPHVRCECRCFRMEGVFGPYYPS